MRVLIEILLLLQLSACSTSSTPSLPSTDAAAAATDSSTADAGDSGATVPSLDATRLGAVCKTFDDCPPDDDCFDFSAIDPSVSEYHCASSATVCGAVTCPSGTSCAVRTANPGRVVCE